MPVERTGRLGFVPPRYGPGVVGGAESVLAETARGLAERGWTVEILTTCARDHFTWANEFPEGVSVDGPLTVRRFAAVVDTPRIERATLHARILAGETLTITEQQRWVNDDLRVPDLFHHLLDRGDEYRALVFAPYLFWPTFACGQVVPERTILMPCLHDEPEARLPLFAPLFSGTHGVWFLSEPEAALAHRIQPLPPRTALIGAGVSVPAGYDPEGFRSRYGLDGRFVLYAGRREGAKGWEVLVDSFADAVARHNLPFTLVTTGTGPVLPPASLVGRVVDLGFLPEDELANAYAAADAYLQPSALESFSRTIMEAWLAGTPVIANADAAVVRWHCERSGAGLLYETPEELAACLDFVAQRPDEARKLASGGRAYVLGNYSPSDVLDGIESTLIEWTRP